MKPKLIFALVTYLAASAGVLAKDDMNVKSRTCYEKYYVDDLLSKLLERQIMNYQEQKDKYEAEKVDMLEKYNNLKAETANLTSGLDRSKQEITRLEVERADWLEKENYLKDENGNLTSELYESKQEIKQLSSERADMLIKETNLLAEGTNLTSHFETSKREVEELKTALCFNEKYPKLCVQRKQEAVTIVEKWRRDNNLANNKTDTMFRACNNNKTTVVEAMLDLGVDIDLPISPQQGKCLHQAAINNYIYLAKLLIQRGANINARTDPETNWTPLMMTSWYGSLEVAKLLLDHGTDLGAKSYDDRTALELAKYYNKPDLIKLLQLKGAP